MIGDDTGRTALLRFVRHVSLGTGVICAVFSAVLGGLLVLSVVKLTAADPLNDPALVRLRAEFSKDTGNESLKRRIRVADADARREFFRAQRRMETGVPLVLSFGALAVVALGVAADLRRRMPDPRRLPPADSVLAETAVGRLVVGWGLALLAAAALAVAFLSPASPADDFAAGAGGSGDGTANAQDSAPGEQ